MAASDFSCALTDATVGADPLEITMCTELSLSENVTSLPEPFWAQPSGYFTE